jgi:predicted DNA-binding WGR domain protein
MERMLQIHSPEAKFWAISVSGSTITIRSGPLHTPGTSRNIECKSDAAAKTTADALLAQRVKDGFREVEAAKEPAKADLDTERALLRDDIDGWTVFADSLLESTESLRGEYIALQVRAARKERGAVGKQKAFLQQHFDALVGAPLAAVHKQVFLDWRFGYARAARIWSSPHSPPIGDAIEAVLQSPACRFLQRLEFGSPGTEGRYDAALRTLAKLPWPSHLDSLYLGNFDVSAAGLLESAWPRLESLNALTPVFDRLRSLEIRAIFNTFGRGIVLPKLERLVLMPSALDARLLTDLLAIEVPQLNEFGLACREAPKTGWEGWARLVRQWALLSKLKKLSLREYRGGALDLLEQVDDGLLKLEVVDLTDSVPVADIDRLAALAPKLKHATLIIGHAVTVNRRLKDLYPKLDMTEVEVKKPKALSATQSRRLRAQRYAGVTE